MVAKIFFMLYNHEGHDVSLIDMLQVIIYGLSLDLSTSLYFLIIPFLTVVVSLWVRISKWVLYIYYVIVAVLLSLAFVADTSLYPFWGFKLNASCLQYLETPKEMMASVSVGYMIIRLITMALLAVFICFVYIKTTPVFHSVNKRVTGSLFSFLCIPFFVIGIRGGVDESTTNIGQAYFSQDLFLNHSAVNPVFSFVSSFEHGEKDYDHYHYFDADVCNRYLEGVYTTESVWIDTLLTTQHPDNIVIILMESCGAVFTELGGRKDIMPHLNQLAKEGICFTRCYANSWRTDRGTVCALSGWPSFPNVSIMKMPDKSQTMPSVASVLKTQGYHTYYLYGGDINFTNMRSYLVATGWDQLYSKENYSVKEQNSSKWGVRDDITFESLYQQIVTGPYPQLIGFSTLSSHEPWDVPVGKLKDEVDNAFYYLDQCIGSLVSKLKETRVWDSTLIVMLSDHGIQYKDLDETKPLRNQIPMIWTGGVVKYPRKIDMICNQSDMAATLLGQLGLNHDEFTFSRDVLSQTYQYPLAVHNYDNAQSLMDSTGFILYDFDASRFVSRQSGDADRMLLVNKAILQKTTNNLKQR